MTFVKSIGVELSRIRTQLPGRQELVLKGMTIINYLLFKLCYIAQYQIT
jgi:hypothetical protein